MESHMIWITSIVLLHLLGKQDFVRGPLEHKVICKVQVYCGKAWLAIYHNRVDPEIGTYTRRYFQEEGGVFVLFRDMLLYSMAPRLI